MSKIWKWAAAICALVGWAGMCFGQGMNGTNGAAGAGGGGMSMALPSMQWNLVIPLVVPLVVGALKGLLPSVPSRWLPVVAVVVGFLSDLLIASVSGVSSNPGLGAILGAAGVGVREVKDQLFRGTSADAGTKVGLWMALLVAAGAIGCAHFDVTQTYLDPETKIVFTNRARATLVFSKEVMKRIDIAKRTKTSSSLIGATGFESSVDSEGVKAAGKAMGDAAAEAMRASLGLPPVPFP